MRAIGWDIGPLVVYSLAGLFHQSCKHLISHCICITLSRILRSVGCVSQISTLLSISAIFASIIDRICWLSFSCREEDLRGQRQTKGWMKRSLCKMDDLLFLYSLHRKFNMAVFLTLAIHHFAIISSVSPLTVRFSFCNPHASRYCLSLLLKAILSKRAGAKKRKKNERLTFMIQLHL